MERPLRPTSADVVNHVLNRANARRTLFDDDRDYATFARVAGAGVCASLHATPGILRHAQPLAFRRLAAEEWRPVTIHELAHADPYATVASASPHGRGRAWVPRALHIVSCRNARVSPDGLLRRGANPVRAGLVERAEPWCWSRAGTRGSVPLQEWPRACPTEWPDWVNEGEAHAQWSAVRSSMTKGQPCGSPVWVEQMIAQ